MSKWVNKEKFEDFKKQREQEESQSKNDVDYARLYPNPKMGSQGKPKEYHLRLLTDPNGDFYKKCMYHMFKSGDNWVFIMCPKTHDMDEYCPWCHATQILYKGSSSDKKKAYSYKRKEKYVGNVFVVKDPRDADENDPDKMLKGKTFLYGFPQTVETLIRKEITDVENGWGYAIFDPEDGYNLIVSIGAKKPDKDGKVWPDYSLTTFAKKPSAIADTEEKIEEIMSTCQDITEYINNSMLSPEVHEKLLKSEMLWDDVCDVFVKKMKTMDEEVDRTALDNELTNTNSDEQSADKTSESVSENKSSNADEAKDNVDDDLGSVDDISDEELLAELDNF